MTVKGSEAGSWEVKGGLGLGAKHRMLQVQSESKGPEGCRGYSESPRLDGEQKVGLAEASARRSHPLPLRSPDPWLWESSTISPCLPTHTHTPPPQSGSAEHCQALPAAWVF